MTKEEEKRGIEIFQTCDSDSQSKGKLHNIIIIMAPSSPDISESKHDTVATSIATIESQDVHLPLPISLVIIWKHHNNRGCRFDYQYLHPFFTVLMMLTYSLSSLLWRWAI